MSARNNNTTEIAYNEIIYDGPNDRPYNNQMRIWNNGFELLSEDTLTIQFRIYSGPIVGKNIGTVDYIRLYGNIVVLFWKRSYVIIYDNNDSYDYDQIMDTHRTMIVIEACNIYGSCIYGGNLFVWYKQPDRPGFEDVIYVYKCSVFDVCNKSRKQVSCWSSCPFVFITKYQQAKNKPSGLHKINLGRDPCKKHKMLYFSNFIWTVGITKTLGFADLLIRCSGWD